LLGRIPAPAGRFLRDCGFADIYTEAGFSFMARKRHGADGNGSLTCAA
jgi:hypothetical protein